MEGGGFGDGSGAGLLLLLLLPFTNRFFAVVVFRKVSYPDEEQLYSLTPLLNLKPSTKMNIKCLSFHRSHMIIVYSNRIHKPLFYTTD